MAKILSLFDGMACGMLAMQKAGVEVERYVAYEIDKYAVQTSSHNFPMIEHRGDVFKADFTEFEGFDFLIGGSPCTYWSIAQKNNRETEASGMGWELFSQYVRALREAKPMFFIYENNKSMAKAIRASIDEAFGFEAVCINSALVSAQNRQRLYWVGKRNDDGTYSKVNVEQPEDRGILPKDILESGADLTTKDKTYCLTASYDGACAWNTIERSQGTMVAEPVNVTAEGKSQTIKAQYQQTSIANICCYTSTYGASGVAEPVCMRYERTEEAKRVRKQYEAGEIKHGFHELSELHPRTDGKSNTLSTVLKDNPICEPVGIGYRGRMEDGKWVKRYESNGEEKANALTTAQTDSMVAEPVATTPEGKAFCLTSNYPGAHIPHSWEKSVRSMVAEPVRVGTYPNNAKNQDRHDSQQYRIYSTEGKSVNLCGNGGGMGAKTGLYAVPVEFDGDTPLKAVSLADGKAYAVYEVKDGQITIKGKQYPIKLPDGFYIIRKLTVRECMRLQTVPEWYEFPVSDTQAYKMLGNGWTVDVIVHLISSATEGLYGKK